MSRLTTCWPNSRTRTTAELRGLLVACAGICLAAGAAAIQASSADAEASWTAPRGKLFDATDLITLTMRAPFRTLIKDRYGKSTYHAGELSYQDADGREVVLPIEIRTRGNTRRNKKYCDFPPLRLRFAARGSDSLFAGHRVLKLVTHCKNKDSYDQYVLQEYLAYRVYNQLSELGHRVRLVRVSYVEANGRPRTTRYGVFLEDWKSVAARNGVAAAEIDGAVNIDKLSIPDANRVALFQYLIGNPDWSMLWPEPHGNCCHNTKPLLTPEGTVVPLPYDFDFSGIVDTPYAVAKGGRSNVRMRRFGGLCATSAELPAVLPLFRAQREAIYALYRDQDGVSRSRRSKALKYLDGFYRVIDDPVQVERRLLSRCQQD